MVSSVVTVITVSIFLRIMIASTYLQMDLPILWLSEPNWTEHGDVPKLLTTGAYTSHVARPPLDMDRMA